MISNGQTRSDGRVLGDGNRAAAAGSICQTGKVRQSVRPGRRLIGRASDGWSWLGGLQFMHAHVRHTTIVWSGISKKVGRRCARVCAFIDDW